MPDSPLLPPAQIRYQMIEGEQELAEACRRWRQLPWVALDTEFVRERTFYPALGLLQVASAEEVTLVDPLKIGDLEPFSELLRDPRVVKVLHSCKEDLEVFDLHLDALPEPLFDTQVAASLTVPGPPPGYARLVGELFDINLPKGETRSKWLRRPLRPAQLDYAALDVAYLLPARQRLESRLEQLGRRHWLDEEMHRLLEGARRTTPDDELYLDVGKSRTLDRRRLAMLRDLFAWRQKKARELDLPRSFVVKDAALIELATKRPRGYQQLQNLPSIDPRTAERYGKALLLVLRRASQLPEDELPKRLPRPVDISAHKKLTEHLRALVRERGVQLNVAPEILANRKSVESVVRRWRQGEAPILPEALLGWREKEIGERLVQALN